MQLLPSAFPEMEQQNLSAPKIKQEKVDDGEINRLAMEMAEKNRQKMISQASQIAQQTQASQQSLQRAGGQQMITFYFNKEKSNATNADDSILPKKLEEKKKGTIDEESSKGRFGWSTIHNVHIPYLFRCEDKYCAVKMVENKLLNKYLSYLPQEITTCIHVRSYYITEIEAKLLNDINSKHCEFQFGREGFTKKDLVVRIQDAKCFYKFLDTCYKKLVQKSPEQSEHCGFVRINGESVVPYTVKDSVKYVPLFYFEGETDTLKLKADKIDSWELAYLKFCCKVQGIRNELFASETCAVVSLDDVKQYFPKDTQFEDWWPQKTADPMRVSGHGTKPAGNWTQRPPSSHTSSSSSTVASTTHTSSKQTNSVSSNTASAIKSNTHVQNRLPSSVNSHASMTNNLAATLNSMSMYQQWAAAASMLNGQAAAAGYVGLQNMAGMHSLLANLTPDQMRRLGVPGLPMSTATQILGPNISVTQATARPPPLVRSTSSTSSISSTSSTSRYAATAAAAAAAASVADVSKLPWDASLRNLYAQSAHQNSSVLASVNQLAEARNFTAAQSNNTPAHNSSSSTKSLSKAPPPLIPVANGLRSDNLSSHKGVGRNGIDKEKLVDVPSFRPEPTSKMPPYRVQKVNIDGRGVFCINHQAYSYLEVNMVAVQDIISDFIPAATLSEVIEVFQRVLSVTVYRANWSQVKALMSAWGMTSKPDIVPLVYVTDFIGYLTHIKFIFQKQTSLSQQAKRIRQT